MDTGEFRKRGKEMVDYVCDYLENIRERRVFPDVQPGFLQELIPSEAPQDPEQPVDVFKDIERVIMPGMVHWRSPNFHAYWPAGHSYAALCGDILSGTLGCIGFSWASSPACTELEVAMMDWLAKALQLPSHFLSGGPGGGVIQGGASEATLVALIAARNKVIEKTKKDNPEMTDGQILSRLVAYCSDQAHSSVERACLLQGVHCHVVQSDGKGCFRGDALAQAIYQDKSRGLIPFYVVATLGTTATCAFDKLDELGRICQVEDLWLHIDAAYAGAAFICPEYRYLMKGIEMVDSFNFNPHKWMLVNFDCAAMWFKDITHLIDGFGSNPSYFNHDHQGKVPDLRDWRITCGSRFRSLKVWFVLRMYGIKGIQTMIRNHIKLAKQFEELVRADPQYEVTHEVIMGLVCFRLKHHSDDVNRRLLQAINQDGRIHLVASDSKGVYFLRFVVCSPETKPDDVLYAWKVIREMAEKILKEE